MGLAAVASGKWGPGPLFGISFKSSIELAPGNDLILIELPSAPLCLPCLDPFTHWLVHSLPKDAEGQTCKQARETISAR